MEPVSKLQFESLIRGFGRIQSWVIGLEYADLRVGRGLLDTERGKTHCLWDQDGGRFEITVDVFHQNYIVSHKSKSDPLYPVLVQAVEEGRDLNDALTEFYEEEE